MPIPIESPQQLGRLIRAARKAAGLRQDDTAGVVGVSDVSLGSLERGAPGARLDGVLRVLRGLGIGLHADVSDSVATKYDELSRGKTGRPRSRKIRPTEPT